MSSKRGFTLVEVIIVLVMMAAIVGTAVLSVGSGVRTANQRNATRGVLQYIRHARAIALLKSRPVVVTFEEVKADYENGMSASAIERRLEEISDPIKPYNTVVGIWGQIEARAQCEMIQEYCNATGLKIPQNSVFNEMRKRYIYSQLVVFQKTETSKPYALYSPYYQWGAAYGVEETERLVDELVQDGLFIRNADGSVYLADWENYIYHFD